MAISQSYEKKLEALKRSQERQRAKLNDPKLQAEKRQKRIEQQAKQAARAKARQEEKLADPEHRKRLFEKEQERQKRQRDRQVAKLSDPDYKKQQIAKQAAAAEEKRLKQTKSPVKKKNTSGLKGRARTAEEKRLESKIAKIGCICCLNQGWFTEDMRNQEGLHFISMHHVEGRTKPHAHAKQLPLCQYHHDTPSPVGAPKELFPLHGVGRKPWEEVNGTQEQLLKQVYEMIGEKMPWINQ